MEKTEAVDWTSQRAKAERTAATAGPGNARVEDWHSLLECQTLKMLHGRVSVSGST